jgi:zinc D-Ala-D-Ala dipeptidase
MILWLLMVTALPTFVPKGEEALVDVAPLHRAFQLDIKYASKDNFAKTKAYSVARCLLRESVAQKMLKAQTWLDKKHPGTFLIFKDCYRPNDVQKILWDAVKGTKMAAYVANPNSKTGSIHSYGAAVDLTLGKGKEGELDMGTAYDHLGPLAEPRHEKRFLKSGQLKAEQIKNRAVLRKSMVQIAGMKMIRNEWWHFNAASSRVVRKKFSRLNVPMETIK